MLKWFDQWSTAGLVLCKSPKIYIIELTFCVDMYFLLVLFTCKVEHVLRSLYLFLFLLLLLEGSPLILFLIQILRICVLRY